jgi:hypothetical protein
MEATGHYSIPSKHFSKKGEIAHGSKKDIETDD